MTFSSSILTKLCIDVDDFNDVYALLDGHPSRTSCLPFLTQTVLKNVYIAHDILSIEKRLYACRSHAKTPKKSCAWHIDASSA